MPMKYEHFHGIIQVSSIQ